MQSNVIDRDNVLKSKGGERGNLDTNYIFFCQQFYE